MEGIRHVEICKKKKKNGDNDISHKDDYDDDSDNDGSYSDRKSYSSENEDSSSEESYKSEESGDDIYHQSKNEGERIYEETEKKQLNKGEKGLLNEATSTKSVNFDSLLKAVIEINDKIEDKERQLKKLGESSNSKHHRNSKSGCRPRTAVLQYREESEYSTSFDANDSDIESTPSIISRTSSSKRQRQPSLRGQQDGLSPGSRINMSFSNEKVRSIDAENQRLLKNLLQTKSAPKLPGVIKKKPQTRVQSASSINRNKRQQEIERENLRLLHKLQSVKPSSALARKALLSDHSKHEQYSGRIGRASRPSSAVSNFSPRANSRSRPRSSYSSSKYFDDTASISSASSIHSQRAVKNNITRENLERQRNWNDRW